MQQAVVVKLKMNGEGRFPGAFYNEQKVRLGLAELALARNVSPMLLDRLEVLRRMGVESGKALEEYMQERSEEFGNSKSLRWQLHLAVSVKGQELDKESLADLADRFMQAFGYGEQPYLVYFHHDTDNNHVHILTTNIDRFGRFINDSWDKKRMGRTMDQVLGITTEKQRERMFEFSFQTEGQFLNIARSCGFEPKREEEYGKVFYTFFRGGMPQMSLPVEQILSRCHAKDDAEDKLKCEKRIREIWAYMHKYRQESMKQQKAPSKGKAKTKKKVVENNQKDVFTTLTHKDGTPLSEQEQKQMRWFKSELKAKFRLDIHFQKDKNGVVRGYGLVDMAGKMAFDGSQVMKLQEIIDYKHSQTHICEDYQTNRCESSQANTAQQQAKPNRKEYEHDAALDVFNGIFSASVTRSADRDYVTIRWKNGSCDSKPISEKQASWYNHAGSDLERQDIATKLALSVFPREVYNHVRDYCIDEYEKGNDVSRFIDFGKCSVYKHKDGFYRARVFFRGETINDTYLINDEDAKAFMAASKDPEQQQQLVCFFAMKYAKEEEARKIRQDLRYDDIFSYDSRQEKSGLAQEIAKGVRSVERTTPGTIDHANAVARQLCVAAYMLRSVFIARGGAGDENREDELRKTKGYEEEIAEESNGIAY